MKKIPLFAQVWQFIKKYKMFNESDCVLIALSGGPDSVALTTLLKEVQANICPELKLYLAHLNHLLRGQESERDESFVYNFARELNLPLITNQIDVANLAKGTNLEAKAREVRYEFLHRSAIKIGATAIATAHNMNDQAETFLMRLIRGAGITGLTGIQPILKMKNLSENFPNNKSIPIIRPLLKTLRSDIESYLKEKNLNACIDSTNFSNKLTRNKIRLDILPEILKINPKAIEAISNTTDMLNEWQEIFIEKLEPLVINNEIRILVRDLVNLPQILCHQKIRDSIENLTGKISRLTSKHILSVDSLLTPGKSGKKILLPNNLEVVREFNYIIIRFNSSLAGKTTGNKETFELFDLNLNSEWQGELFTLSYQEVNKNSPNIYHIYDKNMFALIDLDKVGENLKVRFRLAGDKYIPIGHQKAEKIKRLMIEKRISLSERSIWPIAITLKNEIIWSPKLPIARDFIANSKSSRFAIISAK